MDARARLDASREAARREWSELRGSIHTETGLSARTSAWLAGLAGLAIGLELARRWLPWPRGPREPGD